MPLSYPKGIRKHHRAVALVTAIAFSVAVTAILLVYVHAQPTAAPPAASSAAPTAAAAGAAPVARIFQSHPGPWGIIEYYYIYLEAPDSLLALYPLPNTIPRWSFPGANLDGLHDLLEHAGMPEPLQHKLLNPQAVISADGALNLYPSVPDLESLSPDTRATIYRELAKSPLNTYHREPVMITSGSVAEWLHHTEVRSELQAKIQQMTYRRGATLAFSDVAALLSYAKSDAEARLLFKTLTRTRSLIARLKIPPGTPVEQIADYWSEGHRRKDILPILQSVAQTDGVAHLDLVHLMPALARKVLYTYPPIDLAITGRMPDCHWTSLNFFNYSPQDLFLDTRLATARVLENYEKVAPPYQYGDMLFVLDNQTGNALHSCVYIADTLMFTKNGENVLSPWMLMTLDDIKSIYLKDNDASLQAYRQKAPAR